MAICQSCSGERHGLGRGCRLRPSARERLCPSSARPARAVRAVSRGWPASQPTSSASMASSISIPGTFQSFKRTSPRRGSGRGRRAGWARRPHRYGSGGRRRRRARPCELDVHGFRAVLTVIDIFKAQFCHERLEARADEGLGAALIFVVAALADAAAIEVVDVAGVNICLDVIPVRPVGGPSHGSTRRRGCRARRRRLCISPRRRSSRS